MITFTDQLNLSSFLTLDVKHSNVRLIGDIIKVETQEEYLERVDINSRYIGLEVLISSPAGEYSTNSYITKLNNRDIIVVKYKFRSLTDLVAVFDSVIVINDLVSGGITDALSAEQGKNLKQLTVDVQTNLNNRVLTDVPNDAIFVDTTYIVEDGGLTEINFTNTLKSKLDGVELLANKYIHPTNHAPSIIEEDSNHRFTTDTEKSFWNSIIPVLSGSKASSDEGLLGQLSITNDYVYICVSGGLSGFAIWKKFILFNV